MYGLQLSLLEDKIIEVKTKQTLTSKGDIQYVQIEKLNQNHWVTKHNDLIESTYKLTLQQQRILLIIASRVQPQDDTFKLYRFNTKDIIDILGLKSVSNYYNQIKDIVNGLQKETLTIKTKGRETNFSWVITSDYVSQQGYFQIQLHPELRPYFIELKEKFTKYRLENVLRLNSSYSIRIYELLKQYEGLGNRTFEVDELKFLLSIEPTKYKQYSHLKDRVILPSHRELKEHTDISFEFNEIKTGRKITKIQFIIRANSKNNDNNNQTLIKSDNPLENELLGFGLTKRQITNVRKSYTEKDIMANIEYTNERMFVSNVKKPGAYFMKAIRDNYAAEKPMYTKASESKEKVNSLKVVKEDYEKNHYGRTPEEFENFLLASMNLMDENTAYESVFNQLTEYLKYHEVTEGKIISPSKFNNERIQKICKEVLVEL